MKIIVIYPKGSLNHGQASLDSGFPYRNTNKVMTIEVPVTKDMDDIDICSSTWRYMNRVDGSIVENQLNVLQERSMMVGDSIRFNGKEFKAEMVGWTKVKDMSVTAR